MSIQHAGHEANVHPGVTSYNGPGPPAHTIYGRFLKIIVLGVNDLWLIRKGRTEPEYRIKSRTKFSRFLNFLYRSCPFILHSGSYLTAA